MGLFHRLWHEFESNPQVRVLRRVCTGEVIRKIDTSIYNDAIISLRLKRERAINQHYVVVMAGYKYLGGFKYFAVFEPEEFRDFARAVDSTRLSLRQAYRIARNSRAAEGEIIQQIDTQANEGLTAMSLRLIRGPGEPDLYAVLACLSGAVRGYCRFERDKFYDFAQSVDSMRILLEQSLQPGAPVRLSAS